MNARLESEILENKLKKINKIDNIRKDKILAALKNSSEAKIYDVIIKKISKNPSPPFITSTLQQEAIKRYNFTSKKTMSVAQQLYEGINIKGQGHTGLITYIRTDSFRVADTAKNSAAAFIEEKYGKNYVNINRRYINKKKDAQDAHEAIRPTNINITPDKAKEFLTNDQYKLYTAIWERYTASCMTSAKYDEYNLFIEAEGYVFKYNDKNLIFDGFLRISNKNEEIKIFPEFKKTDRININEIIPEQKFTNPPPRYSEASLVKAMEELGIGRPSTYSPTVSTIMSRNYVSKEKNLFYITELGRLVTELLLENFNDIIDEKFTAALEEKLDAIEVEGKNWKKVISDFYRKFSEDLKKAEKNITEITIEDIVTDEICEKCGANMVIKKGRYGDFLA